MLFINRLSKKTNDSIPQGTGPDIVISVGRHEDRRNRVPQIDEASIKLDPGHRRHMDICDQAGGLAKTRGSEEIGRRWESLNSVPTRPHKPLHRFPKETIILNDRDQ
jgi:hypothetical protein